MIAIIDYGMGNLRSVHKAFAAVGHDAVVTRDPHVLNKASHLVLPGVGAFADCMANLEQYGLIDPIRKGIVSGKPFLGICLGLQLLFTESEEFGMHKGLDIVPGKVRRFQFSPGSGMSTSPTPSAPKVPHMGWNELTVKRVAPPLQNLPNGTHVYFVHSYYVEPSDPSIIATMTNYGTSFVSSIWRDNVFACQYHPEKSQTIGLQIVKNFAEWR
ncbi:MAG TPA: imidazole glycerol phosphate synthase subunit HisH [Nitrospiraceae bacterium]|nr:imidazole glycerol phosphate synthase subunit HisH [Nitrospiraceae bacterium]